MHDGADGYLMCNAVPYSEIASNRPVINISQFVDNLNIRLPNVPALEHHQLISIVNNADAQDTILSNPMTLNSRWVDIPCKILDTSIGIHTYCLAIANSITQEIYRLYFTYLIQDDTPDTPYIYMNR